MLENPGQKDKEHTDFLNPDSLRILENAYVEKSMSFDMKDKAFQFERLGYFALDKGSSSDSLVFNRTVSLKDTWKK